MKRFNSAKDVAVYCGWYSANHFVQCVTFAPGGVTFTQSMPTSYSEQWNLAVQRTIGKDWIDSFVKTKLIFRECNVGFISGEWKNGL